MSAPGEFQPQVPADGPAGIANGTEHPYGRAHRMEMAMTHTPRRKIAWAMALGLLASGCASTSGTTPSSTPVLRTIVINGEGEISAVPDQVRLTAGVVTQAPTAAAVLDANTTTMNRIHAVLKGMGVEERNIQTTNFSLSPQYPRASATNPEPRNIIGYEVSNQVTVVLKDTSKTGATLDALVRNGANQSYGLNFEFSDPKPLIERARKAAVMDAMAKARTLAETAGITLGPVLSIQEGVEYQPLMYNQERVLVTGALIRGTTPISPGEDSVSVNITMTYAIQ
jgi:uncharacterized protein